MPRSVPLITVATALAASLIYGLGAWQGVILPPTGRPWRKPARGPSVLIVTLDTTRADHLGPYGYETAETPTYDRMAREGTIWVRAYSTAPLTIPSHSTIMTGQAPPTHGVRDNGDFILSPDAVTLAERFRAGGWTTAAFTAAFPTQRRWGFDQGFDIYHDPLERQPTELDWRDERSADQVVDDAITTLDALRRHEGEMYGHLKPTGDGVHDRVDPDAPLFVWVHLFDAHWPYEPPEPFKSRHLNAYDGEIAFADSQVARLLAWWDANNPRSTVLVTADHGEGLGDGGEPTHGFLLHDGTIRIPMMARGEGIEAGKWIRDPVGHTDIAPTLLTIAGLPLDDRLQGHDLRDGGSERMYSEALTGQFNLGLAPLHAWTSDDGRFTDGGWGGWYPTVLDRVTWITVPEEGITHEREVLAAMMEHLEPATPPDAAPAALDPDDLARLQALGYIGGDPNAEAGDVDPRDVIDIIPLTWQARQLMGQHRLAAAEQVVAQLERRLPNTFGVDLLRAQLTAARGNLPSAREQLVSLYLRSPSSTLALQIAGIDTRSGSWGEARSWFKEALEHQPASPEAMSGLVRTSLAMGDQEYAEELAGRFLLQYPDHAQLLLARAAIALEHGDAKAALIDARAARASLPYSTWAIRLMADAQWALGDYEHAIENLQDALRMEPTDFVVRLILARDLLLVGRNAEAWRTVAPASRLMPERPDVQKLASLTREALDAERAGSTIDPTEIEAQLGPPDEPEDLAGDTGVGSNDGGDQP